MSFKSFALSAALHSAVAKLGYQQPTPIQQQAIPVAMSGRDMIACAETGSGKTAAFLLPALELLVRKIRRQVLILAPTREIAIQTETLARKLTIGFKNPRIALVIGGADMRQQTRELTAKPHIIIATPGRLIDHLGRQTGLLDRVDLLILDEADRLLDMGFLPDIRRILDRLTLDRQSLLFSATLSREINELAEETLLEPIHVQIGRRAATVSTLDQFVLPVVSQAKLPILLLLLQQRATGGTLIFTRTKNGANRLATALNAHDYNVGLLHGDRTQAQRNAAIADFRAGRAQVMIATDLASRGIDIASITRVINFDVPAYPEDYVHRVGRTARAGKTGQAFTFSAPQDEDSLRKIELLIGKPLPRRTLAEISETPVPPALAAMTALTSINTTSSPSRVASRSFSPRRHR